MGIYAGVQQNGNFMSTVVSDFLDQLDIEVQNVRVLIGHYASKGCKSSCPHCLEDEKKKARRIYKHTERWDTFEWKVNFQNHFKLVHLDNFCFTGGRNLSNSSWTDVTLRVRGKDRRQKLKDHFGNIWGYSYDVAPTFERFWKHINNYFAFER